MLLSEPPAPLDQDGDNSAPVFVAFSDLLACVLGIFVLFFVWIVSFEVSMASELAKERAESVQAKGQLQELKTALAGPLRAGLITFVNGTIGIRGSVLFDTASAELRPEGLALLSQLAEPLGGYLGTREEVLMVSGFTDDLPVKVGPQSPFRDNWELSVHRSLTVVRSLIGAGVPSAALFAAGFGENHPVAPNDSVENRAKNRRVELAPVPRPRKLELQEGQAVQLREATPAPAADKPASVLSATTPAQAPQEPSLPTAGTDAEPQLHAAAPAHAGAN